MNYTVEHCDLVEDLCDKLEADGVQYLVVVIDGDGGEICVNSLDVDGNIIGIIGKALISLYEDGDVSAAIDGFHLLLLTLASIRQIQGAITPEDN